MPQDLVAQANTFVSTYVIPFGWKILGAIAVWMVGSWIVKLVAAAFGRMGGEAGYPAPETRTGMRSI
jgi:hypothetical protein